jgi:hypothetical protein
MKNAILTTFMLLVAAAWAIGQQPSSQTPQNPSQKAQPSSAGETTSVQGCLGRTDGSYALTDAAGKRYEVTGNTTTLGEHVGHEVQLKGTRSEPSTPPGAPAATTNRMEARIDVSSVKHISQTCSAKSNPETTKPPMSEKPPIPPQ